MSRSGLLNLGRISPRFTQRRFGVTASVFVAQVRSSRSVAKEVGVIKDLIEAIDEYVEVRQRLLTRKKEIAPEYFYAATVEIRDELKAAKERIDYALRAVIADEISNERNRRD